MAENAVQSPAAPPVAAAPPADPRSEPKYAGKYADVDGLEKGIREVRRALSLPDLPEGRSLIGTHYADAATAEAEYTSYARLLAKTGKVTGEAPAVAAPAAPKPEAPFPNPGVALNGEHDDVDIPSLVTRAGLNFDDLSKQWSEKGELTTDQYAAIRKVNPAYGKHLVNELVTGMVAKSERVLSQAVQLAGGGDNFEAAMKWYAKAKPNQVEEMRKLISDASISSNPARAMSAFKEILFDYQTGGGKIGQAPAAQARPAIIEGSPAAGMASAFDTIAEYDGALDRMKRGTASQQDIARLEATPQSRIYRMPLR